MKNKSTKKYIKVDDSLVGSPKYEVLEQLTYKDGNREYLVLTDSGYELYPSVTSVLPKPPAFVLETWRNRVGRDYADFNTKASSTFGNRMHDSLTRIYKQIDSYDDYLFEKFLDEVDYIIACELPVVSTYLRVAGTLDLLVMNKKGEIELIDLKNHSRIHPLKDVITRLLELPQDIQNSKKKKWKQQGVCYTHGLADTYGITVDRFSVWCFNQGTGKIEKPVSLAGTKLEKEIKSIDSKLVL